MSHTHILRPTLYLLILACAACSAEPPPVVVTDAGSTDAGSDVVGADAGASTYCSGRVQWSKTCAKNLDLASCAAEEAHLRCISEDSVVDMVGTCLNARPCSATATTCYEAAESKLGTGWRDSCLAKQTACGITFKGAACYYSELLRPAYKSAVQACLSKSSCQEIDDCFKAAKSALDLACPE